jgi:RNA polymerase sigma-70 factor (ECF subfamily)
MSEHPPANSRFPTTAWSMVVKAGNPQTIYFQESLAQLCAAYWQPVFVFIRGKGFSSEDARDYTQEFFTRVIEKQYLAGLDRAKGRFRSFLLAAASHFLSNRRDAERAAKRGGGVLIESFEKENAEGIYNRDPSHTATPETLFEYQWALTLLDRAMKRLAAGYARPDLDRLKPFLLGESDRGQLGATAEQMGISEGALKVAIHRLRKRYGEALRREIVETVAGQGQVEEEIRYLLSVLSRGPQR